ncbi:hypothetical protein SLA2020_325770 [Shorea laevis]
MEIWLAILFSICLAAVIRALLHFHFLSRGPYRNLPPGPASFPIIGNFLWIGKSFLEIELALRNLHQKFGPMVTLHIGPHPAIFVTDHSLIHQALLQKWSCLWRLACSLCHRQDSQQQSTDHQHCSLRNNLA